MDFFLLDCVTSRNCIFYGSIKAHKQTAHNQVRGSNSSPVLTSLWGKAEWWSLALQEQNLTSFSLEGILWNKSNVFLVVFDQIWSWNWSCLCHWIWNLLFNKILSALLLAGIVSPNFPCPWGAEDPLGMSTVHNNNPVWDSLLPLSLIMQECHDRYF